MYKPLILITTAAYAEYQGVKLREDYFRCVERAGGIPLLLPPLAGENAAELALSADGLLLSGGGDIDPQYFDQLPVLPPRNADAARDAWELAVFHSFWQRRRPIFGICRGCQLINVALGGSLYQDIELCYGRTQLQHDQSEDRHSATHKVALISRDLQALFGESLLVNSHHHQAIDQTGKHLRVAARSEDLLIEAITARESNRFCLGVQWHPECLPEHQPLFEAFVQACAEG